MSQSHQQNPTGRIAKKFAELIGQNKTALVTFITAGDPGPDYSVPAMHALVSGGADLLELGVPFSDPEADGPAIQAANQRALAQGMTLSKVLDMVAEFRQQDDSTPVILMGYLNSVLAMEEFAQRAGAAGVDGLIMVNLPMEEAGDLREALSAQHIDLVSLVAPTSSDERAQAIADSASGFIYYVSLKGATGSGALVVEDVAQRTQYLRSITDVPVCVGFGIKDAATAAAVAQHADGVVVGSALVQLMAESGSVEEAVTRLQDATAAIRQGINA